MKNIRYAKRKNINRKRKKRLTNYELAKQTGISRTQIGNYLKGKADLVGENIDKIINVLGIKI